MNMKPVPIAVFSRAASDVDSLSSGFALTTRRTVDTVACYLYTAEIRLMIMSSAA